MDFGKRKVILIVDDQVDLVEILKVHLEEKGYDVVAALDGEAALKIISQDTMPDLILLDMNMPIMNGWDFAHKFYDDYGRASPIVIMTAEEDSQTRAMEIGADTYLGKPFDLDSLTKIVESMI